MVNIQRTDPSAAGPIYDLTRSEGVEQLDALAPPVEPSALDLEQLTAFEEMLGLREVPAQAGALAAPPLTGDSLSTQTGPQIRGQMRKMVLNCEVNVRQLAETQSLQSERPEAQAVRNRLGFVESMMGLLDGMLRTQDDILGRIASDHKS
jgi:hypothetical protein